MTTIRGVAVGIPARDEESRIGAALEAVVRAARSSVPVVVVVAADACRDDTVVVARDRLRLLPANVRGEVVELTAASVGVARQLACGRADARLRSVVGTRAPRWIATTDADTVVPADWLAAHCRWFDRGVDAVAGLVRVAAAGPLRPAVRAVFDDELARASFGHDHVYGANLGVAAAWWHRVGGFSADAVGEDRSLVERLRRAGARVVGVADSIVVTSGRLDHRAPDGFGALLAELSAGGATAVCTRG
jgi:cellulose synthase/poly-beta-1,6-N-acetylglucosamine synthase-like glycosyltransferase